MNMQRGYELLNLILNFQPRKDSAISTGWIFGKEALADASLRSK
jgi:hypothetical protein